MPPKENTGAREWNTRIVRSIVTILGLFTVIGTVLAFVGTNLSLIVTGFRTGVDVSILYVVYKLAQEIHYSRKTC